jgi:hypothetical protein
MRAVLLMAVLAPFVTRANEHRGSLGLTVATGGEFVSGLTTTGSADSGFRLPIELGGTLGLTNKTELRLAGRLAPGLSPSTFGSALSFYAGMRNGLAFDAWRTFFDLELAVHALPIITVGARIAFGLQYDFHPVVGAYVQLGAQLSGGGGLRLSFEATAGVQFRTYVFE